jgi:hypothetical protein
MTAIKGAKAGPRERSSPRNGQPETVPYVYRQQRGNTYAARIAQRNAQAAGQSAALVANPGENIRRPVFIANPPENVGARDSRPVPFADPGALGGPSWPDFGELGGPGQDRETGTR